MRLNKPHPMTALLLKRKREQSGLEQSEFMEKYNIAVSQPTFSRWENGKQAVPVEVLLSLDLLVPVGGME
ncbi:helix-turn-helix transcriptional regulator [Photobacterium chitinilyticum]|uniref:helix-turn-helix domain-containing protein n=1 Tax=Photobacterium chitinilyticum TaxID=2485123 RepID=UPI003D0D3A07